MAKLHLSQMVVADNPPKNVGTLEFAMFSWWWYVVAIGRIFACSFSYYNATEDSSCAACSLARNGRGQSGSPIGCANVFAEIWTSHVHFHSPLLWPSANFVGLEPSRHQACKPWPWTTWPWTTWPWWAVAGLNRSNRTSRWWWKMGLGYGGIWWDSGENCNSIQFHSARKNRSEKPWPPGGWNPSPRPV